MMHLKYAAMVTAAVASVAMLDTATAANAEDGSPDNKVEVLGHMSEKNAPPPAETDGKPLKPPPPRDSTFNPVSKLGQYPNEQPPLDVSGRKRDTGTDKLRNLP